MGLTHQMKDDVARFTSDSNDFGQVGNFTKANTLETASVFGYATKHRQDVINDGELVNSKISSFAVSEQLLVAAGYPVRNANQEVSLIDDLLSVADSSGVFKDYIVRENYPDEQLGLIVLILGDYE